MLAINTARTLWLALAGSACLALHAHVGPHPSVHDTVAGILDLFGRTLSDVALRTLDAPQALALLTPDEREILAAQHLHFRVNTSVVVTVLADTRLAGEPFWLAERGFRPTSLVLERGTLRFAAWEREFPAGTIGLGVNSLTGGGEHYLVAVKSSEPAANLVIDDLYPGQLRLADCLPGVASYADRDETLATIPPAIQGQKLIRTLRSRRDDGRLLGIFRWTEHPSSSRPDQILLTWSGNPQTTQAIQWRTSPQVRKAYVTYGRRADLNTVHPRKLRWVAARTELLNDPRLLGDPSIHRHTAELAGLEPGTTYVYAVGDLVDRGNQRDDWDSFFHNARDVFDRRPLVPAIGNHECQGGHPTLYLRQFALPRNGPATIEAERAYAFHYSNALFVILDSNLDPAQQTAWLEHQLASTPATWKFVAYLRTHPLKDGQKVASPAEGTVYVVSVAGTKMYQQGARDYTAVGLTNVATYQVLDLHISGNRLVYRAYDLDGTLHDQFIIEK